MTRIAVLGNAGRVTGGMIVWVGGELTYAYGRELEEIPPTDWDVMTTDGLTYRMLQSGQAWAMQLDDDTTRAHLEWHGLSPATSYDAHPAGPLPKAVAWGHYEQSCRVTGDLVVRGDRIPFDGFGQRDHSWGFRHWAGLHQWHWVTGFLTDGRAFNLFEVHTHDGATTVNGFVHGPAGDEYVTSVDRVLTRAADGGAESYRMTLTTGDGATLTIDGRAGRRVGARAARRRPARGRARDPDAARRRRRAGLRHLRAPGHRVRLTGTAGHPPPAARPLAGSLVPETGGVRRAEGRVLGLFERPRNRSKRPMGLTRAAGYVRFIHGNDSTAGDGHGACRTTGEDSPARGGTRPQRADRTGQQRHQRGVAHP